MIWDVWGYHSALESTLLMCANFFFWNDFSISKGFATQVLSRLEERMVKHRDCLDAVEASELPVVVRVTFSESVNIAPLFYSSKKFRLVL